MKVVHVITSLNAGGAETMLMRLLAAQPRAARDSVVVSLVGDGPLGNGIRALGVPVFSLGMRPSRPTPAGAARLVGLLRRERPRLVQTWMYHSDLLGGLAAWMLGIPVIWGVRHGDLKAGDNPLTRLTRYVCARLSRSIPAAIVCDSQTSIRIHVKAGYSAEKFVHIPNGYDLASFRPDPVARQALRRELGIPPDAPTVGMVARFHPHKDHGTFVAAATAILRRRDSARFVLCGEGTDERNPELVALLDRAGVRPAFHLLGRHKQPELVYPAFDVSCLSSATESLPNVIGEAMACGVPCVATDVGDVRDLIGETGRVVPPRDPQALADAILGVLGMDRNEADRLGAAARARVASSYEIAGVARRIECLQADVAARARSRFTGPSRSPGDYLVRPTTSSPEVAEPSQD